MNRKKQKQSKVIDSAPYNPVRFMWSVNYGNRLILLLLNFFSRAVGISISVGVGLVTHFC